MSPKPNRAASFTLLGGIVGTTANFPIGFWIPIGVIGFASGVFLLIGALTLLKGPTLRGAWGAAIIWFAFLSLVPGVFWIAVALGAVGGVYALLVGLGGVTAFVLGLPGGISAKRWKPNGGS